jgi:4-hydroxy-3-methylbut-2-enyl diphosphate reductase
MGFKDEKADVEGKMLAEFTSPLVAELRANKGVLKRGDVTIKLAEYYGFCWGVERAVRKILNSSRYPKLIHRFQLNIVFTTEPDKTLISCIPRSLPSPHLQIAMAYQARSHFPDKTIHITNEIIHNPQVRMLVVCVGTRYS